MKRHTDVQDGNIQNHNHDNHYDNDEHDNIDSMCIMIMSNRKMIMKKVDGYSIRDDDGNDFDKD